MSAVPPVSSNPPARKRKRSSLVCSNCKRKKIRCSKGKPCEQCTKTNLVDSCYYDTSAESALPTDPKVVLPYEASAKRPMSFVEASIGNGADGNQRRKEINPFNVDIRLFTNDFSLGNKKNSKKAKASVGNDSHANSHVDDGVTISKTELELLKERLKQIEASIGVPATDAPARKNSSNSPIHNPKEINTSMYGFSSTNLPVNPLISPPPDSNPLANKYWGLGSSPVPSGNSFYRNQSSTSTIPNDKQNRGSIQLPPINFSTMQQPDMYKELYPTRPTDFKSSSPQLTNGNPKPCRLDVPKYQDFIGINPYSNPEETINFFEDYTSIHVKEPLRRINFGPFAWSSLMKRDYGLRLLWDYIIKEKEEKSFNKGYSGALVFLNNSNEISQETTNAIVKGGNSDGLPEAVFEKRALQTDGYDEMVPYNNILKARAERNVQKLKLNANGLPLGLTFYDGQIDRELQLIDKIQVILPKKKVIWKLIKRYFAWLYQFMPFLDEFAFYKDVANIIGPESYEDEKVDKLTVEKKLDLATIGLLLIICRLSYLSLFCNKNSVNEENLNSTDQSPKAQELKYLLSNPININTIDVAQLCLDQFQLLRKTNFTVLQLAFYMRLYHTYAPEDGDGADGGDSQVLGAMLIQMAFSLGLNREPDKFPDVCNDPKLNHLGRKIWYFLVTSDVYLSYTFGNPMSIDKMHYDTKVPFHEPGNETIRDPELDKYITDAYFSGKDIMYKLKPVLTLVLNVEGKIKMKELTELVSDVEEYVGKTFGTLKDCLSPLKTEEKQYIFTRNYLTKFYLSINSFFISLFFHFYLYYESKDVSLSFFYLKKALLISTADIMPYYSDLLGNSEVICDMIINPMLEQVIHKSNQTNLASIVKINFMIFDMKRQTSHDERLNNDKNYKNYFKTLCRFSSCLTRCAEVSISAISKISNRYYYAWRITKGHTFLLKTITSTKFYQDIHPLAENLCKPQYSIQQLEELIQICETTLSKYGKSHCTVDSFYKNMGIKTSPDSQVGENQNKPKEPPSVQQQYEQLYQGLPPMPADGETNGNSPFTQAVQQLRSNRLPSLNDSVSGDSTNESVNSSIKNKVNSESTFPSTINLADYHNNQPSNLKTGNDDNIDSNFGFDFVDNASIDRLWLNLISVKHDNQIFEDENNGGDLSGLTPGYEDQSRAQMNQVPTPGKFFTPGGGAETGVGMAGSPTGIDRFRFDMELESKFDIFSDLPFDKMFNLGN